MKTWLRRFAACTSVAALLFAQLALSAFACPAGFAAAAPAAQAQAMTGCDGMGPGSVSAPLCASHCADGAQSFEKPVSHTLPPAVLVGTIRWQAPCTALAARTAPSLPVEYATPPPGRPLSIRNCCLRI